MDIIKKKRVLAVIISLFLVVLCVAATPVLENKFYNPYNENPDIETKVVGSDMFNASRITAESIDDLASKADLIVIGTVISDGATISKEIQLGANMSNKLNFIYGKSDAKYSVTQSQIKIEEVLSGDIDTDVITLNQLGKAGSDDYQTKAKKSEKMLLLLKESDLKNTYASVDFEDGMFLIDGKDNTLSLSRNMAVAKYDSINKSILINDIKEYIKKVKNNL